MAEKTYLAALLQGNCPRCREGNIFTYPISRIAKFNVMNERCSYCDIRLQPEPGFYQGAMYIGYGFTIAFIVVISLILYLSGNYSEWVYIATVIGVMFLMVPLNYRYSRIVYLYLFGGITYDASFKSENQKVI